MFSVSIIAVIAVALSITFIYYYFYFRCKGKPKHSILKNNYGTMEETNQKKVKIDESKNEIFLI